MWLVDRGTYFKYSMNCLSRDDSEGTFWRGTNKCKQTVIVGRRCQSPKRYAIASRYKSTEGVTCCRYRFALPVLPIGSQKRGNMYRTFLFCLSLFSSVSAAIKRAAVPAQQNVRRQSEGRPCEKDVNRVLAHVELIVTLRLFPP